MDGEGELHILLLPFLAMGHLIPIVDIAKLFASRGLKATIVATSDIAPSVAKSICRSQDLGLNIAVKTINLPAEVEFPEGCESFDEDDRRLMKLFIRTSMVQQPVEKLLQEFRYDYLVADFFFPWASDSAIKFGIPRLVFHCGSFFSLCAEECIRLYSPHKQASSDSEPFVLPHLPEGGDFEFTRTQIPSYLGEESESFKTKWLTAVYEAEMKSFGVVVDSFYELEPAYADHYRTVLGRNVWHVGPVSLCNRGLSEKAERGRQTSIGEECLKWLDSKKPNSVIYVCFGSVANLTDVQLKEIATGLEASGQDFIWVVRKNPNVDPKEEEWLPEGFEKRMEGKGLIIRGWAPQLLILGHEATGGFLTHCGWNSTLECITAGKPMLTWPVSSEQFFNEKLVTHISRSGVRVGAKEWVVPGGTAHSVIASEAVEKGVRRVMEGEEAEELRNRAKKVAEKAKMAVQEGGSSSTAMDSLIQELKQARAK